MSPYIKNRAALELALDVAGMDFIRTRWADDWSWWVVVADRDRGKSDLSQIKQLHVVAERQCRDGWALRVVAVGWR